MNQMDRVEALRRRASNDTVRAMVTVALLGVLAATVITVPATGDEGEDVTTPEVSFYTVVHRWGGFFDPVNRAILYSGRLDDRGELSAYEVGDTGFKNIVAIAFSPGGTLFGVQGANGDNLGPGTLSLVTIDTRSGRGEIVGPLGASAGPLTFDCAGNLWMAGWGRSAQAKSLHSVDPHTGEATEVGPLGQDVFGLAGRGTTVFGVGEDDLVTIDTSTGAATEVGLLADAGLDPAELAFGPDGTLWGPYHDDEAYHRPGDEEAGLFTVDTDSGSVTARAASPYGENGRPSYRFHTLAIRGPLCGAVPARAASSTGSPSDGPTGHRDDLNAEGRSGAGARQAQRDADGPGPASPSDRSEDGTVADHAPTVGGDGTAVERDDRALMAKGQLSEEPATTGSPTARLAALLLAALAVMATGWSRLSRSRS